MWSGHHSQRISWHLRHQTEGDYTGCAHAACTNYLPTVLTHNWVRRVNVWDLSRIGQEQSEEDKEDGPPELLVSAALALP